MKRVYHSKYLADSEITEAQYLTEFICERIAKKDKLSLGVKFWDSPKWNKTFVRQVVAANALLKEYPIGLILKALAHKKGQWITSLGAKSYIAGLIDTYFSKEKQIEGLYEDLSIENELIDNDIHIEEKKKVQPSMWERLNG